MAMNQRLMVATCLMLGATMVGWANGEKPYPPTLQPAASMVPPTQEQKLWALGTCAILTEGNQANHELLGGSERTQPVIEAWKESLVKWWGVHNAEELLETLTWIEHGGHRIEFDGLARELSSLAPEQLASIRTEISSNPSISNKVEIVLQYKDEFGSKSIAAWDYDRYVALCGWGYLAGYLSEADAWQRIMPAARLLQKTFDSWKDLGNNHVVGREFWSWNQTQRSGASTRQAYAKLLSDPSSPWVRHAWDTDLSPVPLKE